MNILNNVEAFAALQSGKNLLCRHIEGEFAKLNEFPATVFGNPEYQFCIDIEKIELAGFTFTKPCTLDELVDEQKVFWVDFSKSTIIAGDFSSKNTYLVTLVNNGVVQRDFENAQLFLKGFQAFVGINQEITLTTCDPIFNDANEDEDLSTETKSVKSKGKKKTKEVSADPQLLETEKDIILDGISSSKTECEIDSLCFGLEKHSFTPDQLDAINEAKNAKLAELAEIKSKAEDEKHDLLNVAEEGTQDSEFSVLCEAFIGEILNAKNKEDLDFIRRRINSNGALTEQESTELSNRLTIKAGSFDNVFSTKLAEPTQTNGKKYIEEEEGKYQKKLVELKKRVDESKTVTEVNAVTKYTNSWSAEQRAPLLQYIHKRLEELKKEKQANEPSLLVKIQNAPDLATLDAYEIDIHSLDPLAQPKMMQAVKTRKLELEKSNTGSPIYLIDEDLP
ncbi:hypothetical protein CAT75_03760 [Acinetobacter baumannii]|uniref:hypothetical protein n=1 Tax=Acinetobacter baumannii TaxID=470 RepID=UPI000A38C2F9|nr:hypothetical protein [Acinetobacter baumannii]OTT73138.1 hypothetical protein CAT75_03760 [Acinetobacter baumannii]